MAMFMTQARLGAEAWRALLADPQDRTAPVAKICEAHGGKLHDYFFTMGEHDVMAIIEAPDTETAMAILLSVAGSGAVSGLKTTPLIRAADAVGIFARAAEKAGDYTPPGG